MIRERGLQLPHLPVIGHEGPLWLSPTRSLTHQPCSPKCFGHSTVGGHEIAFRCTCLAAIAGRAIEIRETPWTRQPISGGHRAASLTKSDGRFGSTFNTLIRTTSPGVAILHRSET
jgi:hypothetical protein